jgi:hypothetical protein
MAELRFNLDLVEIRSPCKVPWESMRGSDRVRYCDLCRLNVYELSELPRDEAEALIRQNGGRLCVRFYRRADGTVVTRDCVAVRWTRAIWHAAGFVVLGLVSVLAAASWPWAARQLEQWYQDRTRKTRQGGICPPSDWRTQPQVDIAPRHAKSGIPDNCESNIEQSPSPSWEVRCAVWRWGVGFNCGEVEKFVTLGRSAAQERHKNENGGMSAVSCRPINSRLSSRRCSQMQVACHSSPHPPRSSSVRRNSHQ